MYKKWKSVAALGMAVLIGCMMPVSTMMAAAEDSQEDVQEIEADSVSDDGIILDDENASDEENVDAGIVDDEKVSDETDADEDENTGDEVNADEDENADDEISVDEDEDVDDEVNTDNDDIAVMSEAEELEAGDTENTENLASVAAPEIEIKWQGKVCTNGLGGKVDFEYVNNHNQVFECSVSQADQEVSLYYCLKSVSTTDEAEEEAGMNSLSWKSAQSSLEKIPLSSDGNYVLYVKAVVGEDGPTTYARSRGIVVDTVAPVIVEDVVNGGTYQEGTEFHILDTNLESVKVNGTNVSSEWNTVYRVSANGTSSSCEIWAKDKAGNEMTCSITVSKSPAGNVISENGVYSLKAGTSYQLAAGKWQVGGDKSVYSGGSAFYVSEDGNYTFTKR